MLLANNSFGFDLNTNLTAYRHKYHRVLFWTEYTLWLVFSVFNIRILVIMYKFRKIHFKNLFFTIVISMGFAECFHMIVRKLGEILVAFRFRNLGDCLYGVAISMWYAAFGHSFVIR